MIFQNAKLMEAAIDEAYAPLIGNCVCQFCNGKNGHDELVWTGDEESLGGHEVWFCCYDCRDKGEPCETYHQLAIPPHLEDK